jgi:uncharacterized membrane protein YedE/YeeE
MHTALATGMPLLPHHLPWYVVGPLIGFCPVALYAVANKHLGASAAYAQAARALVGRVTEPWRAYYFIGLVIGAALIAVLQGGPRWHLGYHFISGWMPLWLAVVVLFSSGLVMGYGARWAGGCTSGHGLCGTAIRSAGSLVATATFFLTAIGISFALQFISGGRA